MFVLKIMGKNDHSSKLRDRPKEQTIVRGGKRNLVFTNLA